MKLKNLVRELNNLNPAVTIDGKEVDLGTIELDGTGPYYAGRIGLDDALPDIFASEAQFVDGTELDDNQLGRLTDEYPELIQNIAIGADPSMEEGSCGYTVTAKGEELDTPGGIKGMPADTRTMGMMREFIKKEVKHLFKK